MDSAPNEFDELTEYVTHKSNEFGVLSKQQQRKALMNRDQRFSTLEEHESEIEGLACIYKFNYPVFKQKQEINVEQIAVGLVVKVHGDSSREDALVDIQFCPAKGAKPQTSKQPDTLYQDIQSTMSFNVKNRTKKKAGNYFLQVPDIEEKQQRSVLLAYNLDINKDGTFGVIPRVGNHGSAVTSLQFADAVIKSYYESRKHSKA